MCANLGEGAAGFRINAVRMTGVCRRVDSCHFRLMCQAYVRETRISEISAATVSRKRSVLVARQPRGDGLPV